MIIELFVNILKKNKLTLLLAVGVVIGIILIFAGEKNKAENYNAEEVFYNDEAYAKMMEVKLEDIINEIEGVSEAKVVITLKSGAESVFASDEDGQKDKYVVTGDGLVCVKTLLPTVEGVAVVCRGGNNPAVKEKITSLVCSLLGLYSTHVYVTE